MNRKGNVQLGNPKIEIDQGLSCLSSSSPSATICMTTRGAIVKYVQTTETICEMPYEATSQKWELNERLSIIDDRINKIEKNIEHLIKTAGYEQYIVIPINEVFIKNDKVKLSKPISLIVQFENGQYIVSYNNLGLLAVSDSIDVAIDDIQREFSGLWDDYVTCSEEELTISGIEFKNKLKEYVNDII